MAETIYVRGEGGGIHEMDLPLPEPIAERLRKGMLQRVNEDGSPYIEAESEDEPTGTGKVPAPGTQAPGLPLTQPAKNADKATWVGWAVVKGATPEEADGMTKGDLIEKYGTPTSEQGGSAMTLPPLAVEADAIAWGYALDPARAARLLARASVRVRRAAGQPITPSVVTVELPTEDGAIELPAPPVLEVQSVVSVAEDGTTAALTGWRWDGDRLHLTGCLALRVQVTYRRGWTTVPEGVVELVCEVADRLGNTPVGMEAGIRERAIDDFREVYAAEQVQTAGDLLPGELTALRRELGERCVWVVGSR